jgi:hypothetical protein
MFHYVLSDHEIKQIAFAKRTMEQDPGLAAFALRDLKVTAHAGLTDLVACLANPGSYPHENDVKHILSRIEAVCSSS